MKFRIGIIISAGLLAMAPGLALAEAAQEFMLKNGMKINVAAGHLPPPAAQMRWYQRG